MKTKKESIKTTSLTLNSKKLEKLTLKTTSGGSSSAINIVNFLLNDMSNEDRLNGVSAKTIANGLGVDSKAVRGAFRKVFGVGKPNDNNNYKPFGNATINGVEYAVGIVLKPTIHYTLMTSTKEVDSFGSTL